MHSCQRIYKLHSPLHSLSNTHTRVCVCPKKRPKKHQHKHICIHIHGCMQETQQHTLTPSGISGPRNVFPLTLSENWQAGQTTNNYPQSTGRREQKKKKDRRLRKQIEVMSSELNGKPCVRKTGESIHIYCCQDFNINIIESTSDVSLSADWLTKTSTSCRLYLRKIKI